METVMAKKKPGQPALKKKGSGGKKREIDWSSQVRWAEKDFARNKGEVDRGETYASGRIRERGKAPSRTDGQQYG